MATMKMLNQYTQKLVREGKIASTKVAMANGQMRREVDDADLARYRNQSKSYTVDGMRKLVVHVPFEHMQEVANFVSKLGGRTEKAATHQREAELIAAVVVVETKK